MAINEYPGMDDLALRILEVLAPIFPKDADFQAVVSALPSVGQDEILSRIDDMQKLGWVDGPLIRNGIGNSVKAVSCQDRSDPCRRNFGTGEAASSKQTVTVGYRIQPPSPVRYCR